MGKIVRVSAGRRATIGGKDRGKDRQARKKGQKKGQASQGGKDRQTTTAATR
jgi:hypothetical protein